MFALVTLLLLAGLGTAYGASRVMAHQAAFEQAAGALLLLGLLMLGASLSGLHAL